MSQNHYEERARAVKAARLADLLTTVRATVPAITPELLEAASDHERRLYARIAGTGPPSDETWGTVLAILKDRDTRHVCHGPTSGGRCVVCDALFDLEGEVTTSTDVTDALEDAERAYEHRHRECGPDCCITGDECPPFSLETARS